MTSARRDSMVLVQLSAWTSIVCADQDVTRLRQTWDGFRPTVRGTARAEAVRSFESHLDLLAADVRARNSPQALREVGELRRIATTFGAAPSG